MIHNGIEVEYGQLWVLPGHSEAIPELFCKTHDGRSVLISLRNANRWNDAVFLRDTTDALNPFGDATWVLMPGVLHLDPSEHRLDRAELHMGAMYFTPSTPIAPCEVFIRGMYEARSPRGYFSLSTGEQAPPNSGLALSMQPFNEPFVLANP